MRAVTIVLVTLVGFALAGGCGGGGGGKAKPASSTAKGKGKGKVKGKAKAKPKARPAVADSDASPKQPAAPTVKPTCEGAAAALVKERGFGTIPPANHARARRAGEAEAVAACLDDQWSDAVLECTMTRPSPASCLGQLDAYQQSSYEAHFGDWEHNWTKGPGKIGADDPAGGEGGVAGGEAGGAAGGEESPEEWIPCEGAVGEVASYAPAIKPRAREREFAVRLRSAALIRTCEHKWTLDDKKCFTAAKDAGAIASCRSKLEPSARNAIGNRIADADARLARVLRAARNRRAIECKAVAKTYFSGEMTSGKLTPLAPAERARVIAESRDKMTAACVAEKWRPAERACLTLTSNEYSAGDCFVSGEVWRFGRFQVPAGGVLFKVGIAECDQLTEVVGKLGTCDKLEQELRDMLLQSYSSQLTMWLETRASEHAQVAAQCKETTQRYIDGGKERGCTL